jgi:hypothetical protein
MRQGLSLVVSLLCALASAGCPSSPSKPATDPAKAATKAGPARQARPASSRAINPILRSFRDALLVGANAAQKRRVGAVGIGDTANASSPPLMLTIVDHGARVLGPLVLDAAASDTTISTEARALAKKLATQLRGLPALVDDKGLGALLKGLSKRPPSKQPPSTPSRQPPSKQRVLSKRTAELAAALIHARMQKNGGKVDATANTALTIVAIIKLLDRTLALYETAGSVDKLAADGHVVASVASLVWSARSTTAAKPAFDSALRLLERTAKQARHAK